MIIKIEIWDRQTALIAIAYTLKNEGVVNSAETFKNALADYIRLYGESCVMDHETECEEIFMNAAELVTNKYFKS